MLELLHDDCKCLVVQLHLPVFQPSGQQLLAIRRLLEFSLAELLADFGTCLCSHHEIEPVGRRLLVLSRHDFDDVSCLELFLDRHCFPVDLASGTFDTEVAVDVESEIQHSGILRQFSQLS